MTATTSRNEAAERLHDSLDKHLVPLHEALVIALAAERRATVERIRAAVERYRGDPDAGWLVSAIADVLDEVAK